MKPEQLSLRAHLLIPSPDPHGSALPLFVENDYYGRRLGLYVYRVGQNRINTPYIS
jgi:hypothetical protein